MQCHKDRGNATSIKGPTTNLVLASCRFVPSNCAQEPGVFLWPKDTDMPTHERMRGNGNGRINPAMHVTQNKLLTLEVQSPSCRKQQIIVERVRPFTQFPPSYHSRHQCQTKNRQEALTHENASLVACHPPGTSHALIGCTPGRPLYQARTGSSAACRVQKRQAMYVLCPAR